MSISVVLISVIIYFVGKFPALSQTLAENTIVQALLVSTLGGLLYIAINFMSDTIERQTMSKFWRSVTISNRDPSYAAVLEFVTKHSTQAMVSTNVVTKKRKGDWAQWRRSYMGVSTRSIPELDLFPVVNGSSFSFFQYKGRKVLYTRKQGQTLCTGYDRRPQEMEEMTLSAWGSDNSFLKNILTDALVAALEAETEDFNVWVLSNSWIGGWEKALTKPPRAKTSVVLDEDLAEHLLHDAGVFLKSAQWYKDSGIPYRRGYLLFGPPGCGKTSFCQVLAGALKLDICMLSLSNDKLDDNMLAQNFRDAPQSAILLLEDVDAVFVNRDKGSGSKSGVSFSGLLNAIDGVASQEGRIFFMTTNHLERLDEALIRPGRCDVRVELKKASKGQMERLFLRFFPDAELEAKEFALKLPTNEISMAQLQGHLLEHKTSAQLCIDSIPKLLQRSKPQIQDTLSTWEHLRRVGLQDFAPIFEYHGYTERRDFKDLKIDRVQAWSPELGLSANEFQRLSKLLGEDEVFMKQEYQTADLSTIREMFFIAFPAEYFAAHEEKMPKLRRLASHERNGLVSVSSDSTYAEMEADSKKVCEALSRNGKSIVSLWQVRALLTMSASPEEVVYRSAAFVQPRTEQIVNNAFTSPATNGVGLFMPIEVWLKRAGLWHLAEEFKSESILHVGQLYAEKSDLGRLQELAGSKQTAKFIQKLLEKKPEDENITQGFSRPEYAKVKIVFTSFFPKCAGDLTHKFAQQICDPFGLCKCSLFELQNYLIQHTTVESAIENIKNLLQPAPVPVKEKPTPPLPTEWVYGWLKSYQMEKYARDFINKLELKERHDFIEPLIDAEEVIKGMPGMSLGDQRKFRRMVRELENTSTERKSN